MFATLCDQKGWPCYACTSLTDFLKTIEKLTPRTIITRYRLEDGYSDEVLSLISASARFATTRVMVLLPANAPTLQEIRQVDLGADCVMRDPLRLEVLLAHVGRNRGRANGSAATAFVPEHTFEIAGVTVHANQFLLAKGGRSVEVAPQVVALLRLLARSIDKVLPYPFIYSELFNRRFTGDTSNARVLLAKAATNMDQLGVDFRTHIKVIAKSGYLYQHQAPREPRGNAKRTAV